MGADPPRHLGDPERRVVLAQSAHRARTPSAGIGRVRDKHVVDMLCRRRVETRVLAEMIFEAGHELVPRALGQHSRRKGHVAGRTFFHHDGVARRRKISSFFSPCVRAVQETNRECGNRQKTSTDGENATVQAAAAHEGILSHASKTRLEFSTKDNDAVSGVVTAHAIGFGLDSRPGEGEWIDLLMNRPPQRRVGDAERCVACPQAAHERMVGARRVGGVPDQVASDLACRGVVETGVLAEVMAEVRGDRLP